jgi:hypothetical protein
MERIVHKSQSFREAQRWDIKQHLAMTPRERIRVARELQRKVYSSKTKDVRACHRTR